MANSRSLTNYLDVHNNNGWAIAMKRQFGSRPMEILLIEDNFADAGLAIEALKSVHVQYRLTLSVDGVEAMEILRQQGIFHLVPRPDLVLLDLGLPKKDGREVLAEMRADPNLQSIPVVILTASTADSDYLKSQLMDVDAYMVKPVSKIEFLAVVRQLRGRWLANMSLPQEVQDDEYRAATLHLGI